MKVRSMRNARVALVVCLSMLAVLALGSSPAGAARSHPFKAAFASECTNPRDVAVDEANGWVYVYCPGSHALNGGGIGMIKRFDLNGNPVNFTHNTPFQGNGYVVNYVSGNAITHVPDPANIGFAVGPVFGGSAMSMDVDNSASGHPGFIYATPVNGARNIEIFEPSGRWVGAIPTPGNAGNPQSVGIDDQGFVYSGTNGGFGRGKIEKFNLAFKEVEQIFFDSTWNAVRPDSTHGIWAGQNAGGTQSVFRFEADQFNTNLKTDGVGQTEYAIPGMFSPFAPAPLFPGANSADPHRFDVDPDNDDLYMDMVTSIVAYAKGTPTETAHQIQPAIGTGQLTASRGIHVTKNDFIYASRSTSGGQVAVFEPGGIIPKATTHVAKLADIGHTSVTVRGLVDADGGTPITTCKVQYGPTTTYSSPPVTCAPDPASAPPGSNFSGPTEVSAVITGATGQELHYRFTAANASGEGLGVDRAVAPAAVLNVKTDPATEVDTDGATFNGSLNPDSISTTYKFQYGLNTAYRQETPVLGPVAGATDLPVSTAVTGLQSGRTYHYRLMAINANGSTFGQDQTFNTPSPPQISGVHATEVTETSATLKATVNPVGYATSYRFEYGTTPEYGTSIPIPDGNLPASNLDQNVSVQVEGLQPNLTHHFRIVASNQWGDSVGDDTTFDFAPPSCPNAHVRQQTGSNYLPDCRAYEVVSPENAGSAVFFPSNEMLDFGAGFGLGTDLRFANWVQNTGLATSPSRFMYVGSLGAVPGLDPPNSVLDSYLATRTTSGWKTTYPGLKGSEALTASRRQCSIELDLCLDHPGPDLLGFVPNLDENAPHVFTASGKKIGQWPTNVNVIPEGTRFSGDVQASGDFSHFAFSSRNVPFAAGGVVGPPGSAYDNEIVSKTISIISKLPNGADIPQDPKGAGGALEYISFSPRGVSRDGTHILMRTKAAGGQHHLYMRVNDSVTYDIARGAGAKVIGSTSDGTKVVYTSTAQVLPGDTDTSTDVYMWSEPGDTLTILSQGNGQGNSDICSTNFAAQCSAQAMTTERGTRGGYPGETSVVNLPGIDSTIARVSGDVFFYSPENLDAGAAAAPNERNLYLSRNAKPQFVATLDPGTQINRLQISADGSRAAFVTAARLTGYDNKGFKVMYTYNAETGLIRCASCNPSGLPPTADVSGSEGGPFMSDDGRAFFATRDSLVPQDTDGITSVYEFVDGRPQLISSGTGSRDFSGAGIVTAFFVPEHIGLESVSHDGVDVIFSTYDTLVPQDENGAALKFYDARTGGGFEVAAELAPCVAADECHGEDSSEPSTRDLPSTANLGAGSNLPASKTTRRCKKGLKRKQGRCVKRHRQRRAENARTGAGRG